ncbi:hypothetical protein PsYK624_063400 [Phanerochaete sordida]|uniref:Uncharacterized protein n=1 Tax=Phanerochaete sordida TaxID=48140 RepID=A0A9P3G6K4_9APHY|nr:hypothetical protein PsYK624_063400 [Phanerochaete sordida]
MPGDPQQASVADASFTSPRRPLLSKGSPPRHFRGRSAPHRCDPARCLAWTASGASPSRYLAQACGPGLATKSEDREPRVRTTTGAVPRAAELLMRARRRAGGSSAARGARRRRPREGIPASTELHGCVS